MKSKLLGVLLLTVITFASCKKDPEPRVTGETIRNDFRSIDLSPGPHDVSLEVGENIFYHFRVIVPDVDVNKNYPLIMAFHGASGGDPNAHKTTECYIEPGFKDIEAFIIHPNADAFEWYQEPNQRKVQFLISLAVQEWPIDENKIAATGYSNGGNMSWYLAEVASDVFSASIPIASSFNLSETETTSRKIHIPVYVIHGEDDELFPLEDTEKWVEESNAAGSDITLVVADSLTHFKPCEYVPYVQDAVVWLKAVWE